MNNDADLIFTAVWQQMIGFSNVANLSDLDGGPHSYLDLSQAMRNVSYVIRAVWSAPLLFAAKTEWYL